MSFYVLLLFISFGLVAGEFKKACDWVDAVQSGYSNFTSNDAKQEILNEAYLSLGFDTEYCLFPQPAFKIEMTTETGFGGDCPGKWKSELQEQVFLMKPDEEDLLVIRPDLADSKTINVKSGLGWSYTSSSTNSKKILKIYILTINPSGDCELNTFAINEDECNEPLPIQLFNEDNQITCVRIALFPNTCDVAMGITDDDAKGSQEFQIQIGTKALDNGVASGNCDYSSSATHRVLFTAIPLGSDEDDRTWKRIMTMEGERKGEGQYSNIELKMYQWAYRTDKDGLLQISYVDDVVVDENADASQRNEDEVLQMTADLKRREDAILELYKKKGGNIPRIGSNLDLGRVIDSGKDAGYNVIVWNSDPVEKCTTDVNKFPVSYVQQNKWIEMRKIKAGTLDETSPYCLRFKSVKTATRKQLEFHEDQCKMTLDIEDQLTRSAGQAKSGERDVSYAVYIQVSDLPKEYLETKTDKKKKETIDLVSDQEKLAACKRRLDQLENKRDATQAEFMMVLGTKTDSTGWRMLSPMISTAVRGEGKSWRWKGDEYGDLAIKFKEVEEIQTFQSNYCKINSGESKFPVDLIGLSAGVRYQCMRVYGRSEKNCEKALGMSEEKKSVSFEATLATAYTLDDKNQVSCIYGAPFVITFLSAKHYLDEKPRTTSDRIFGESKCPSPHARRIVVSGTNAPSPEQWRWRSDEKGRLEITFPIMVTWDGEPKRAWEKFVSVDPSAPTKGGECPVSVQNEFPPIQLLDFEIISKPPYNIKDVPWYAEANDKQHQQDETISTNSIYKCLKLNKNPQNYLSSDSNYRQATMIEQMKDMAIKPSHSRFNVPPLNRIFTSYENYADMRRAVKDHLSSERYHNSITNEGGTEYENLAAGYVSHFSMIDTLPAGHPRIEKGKLVHTEGMVAKCEFVSSYSNQYSGLLGNPRVPLIARFSSATSLDAPTFVPGWSFKFFRDAPAPNADLLVYNSFKPKLDCDIFKYKMSNFPEWIPIPNEVEPMKNFDHSMRFLLQRGKGLRREYNSTNPGTKYPMRLGISHLFMTHEQSIEYHRNYQTKPEPKKTDDKREAKRDEKPTELPKIAPESIVKQIKFPAQLILVPTEEATKWARHAINLAMVDDDEETIIPCPTNKREMIQKQLSAIPPRTPLFGVYAINAYSQVSKLNSYIPQLSEQIGTIYLQEPFFSSWYADAVVHFKHELYESDLQTGIAAGYETKKDVDFYSETDTFAGTKPSDFDTFEVKAPGKRKNKKKEEVAQPEEESEL